MAIIGYHASHEQFSPSALLAYSRLGEACGFKAINCSDHFKPWSVRQGESGFSFAWLGAAMQPSLLPFGVVCAPGYRYHPAIVAQAIATLCEMFPDRFWVSLGSGEAMNERVTGLRWPLKPERNARLTECIQIIKKLLHGETVTHKGLVVIEDAKLFTLPPKLPLLFGAAVTGETAEFLAPYVDGLITINRPLKALQQVIDAFRGNGGEGKPVYLKLQISFDSSYEKALMGAHDQWRTNIFSGTVLGDLWSVEQFDALGEHIQPEELKELVHISSSTSEFKDIIGAYADLGFERIFLHNVNRQQEQFIEAFGKDVLPAFQ